MARKIKLTRPELKRQRDMLRRFERYLPMLKLKQQQLQLMVRKVAAEAAKAEDARKAAEQTLQPYKAVLADTAGVDIDALSQPDEVKTDQDNIAGVWIPVLEDVRFPTPSYSLFSTPAWVDGTLKDKRNVAAKQVECEVLREQLRLIKKELSKIMQRVNLFEKVKIPECREAIRRIRIQLGDEQTAAVGRAKIAKGKTKRSEETVYGGKDVEMANSQGEGGPA
ncbi:MAG: V-type ATP synthase subunit D [Planctomycetes bacterium]|jgi:V/A-type H+-transporting ATPase subunit D|nr:V-type ATP synthase subunit D [Phycisphaerae bacterium]NBB94247.1 V-type ATP synthase subunit D [Planctomycetota bacterium]